MFEKKKLTASPTLTLVYSGLYYTNMYRNLKDHKFPMRRHRLVCIIGMYLQNILTLQTLEVLR